MIYDIGGKLVAEYGGVQPADEGGVKYVLSDWQGSTRAVVGNTGNVQARSDYTAFGEEIQSGAGLRTANQGFGSVNALRQKYGLTERDDATGLDHTWFRKHENQAGRWTSPDPYKGSMSLGDPQSFNRYSYVTNQPTNFVDPSGLLIEYYCYDINTYWSRGPLSSGVMTTTRCHYRILPDEGSGGLEIDGGGGPVSERSTGPCAGRTPTYTQERKDHIWDRHGNPAGGGGSLYILSMRDLAAKSLYNAFAGLFGWEQLTIRDVFELKIQRRNHFTVNSATAIPSGNNYVYVSAEYFRKPPDTQGEVVGVDSMGPNAPLLQYTNVNTVVVNSDCGVVTSHPGMPTRPPGVSPQDPRIFGSPTWWNLTQFKYIW